MRIKVLLGLLVLFITGSGVYFYCYSSTTSNSTDSLFYKDGVYQGSSRSIYTEENFWGSVTIQIKNGKIATVNYEIINKDSNEVFGEYYENHYAGNLYYMKQCRNDWKGVQTYPQLLLNTQNVCHLDAITGATWSFNLFKDSVKNALTDAYFNKDYYEE